jgi:hypothetical protein
MIARLVAIGAAIAAVYRGVRVYSFPGGLDSLDSPALRTDLVFLALAIVVCVVALKVAHKKGRPPSSK